MRYPGGKGKSFQHIINLMPPHRVYIETHLGGGAVMRNKRPAETNIGIDADANVIDSWRASAQSDTELICGRAEDFLREYAFCGDELLYVDPPYHPETRRRERVYFHDYSIADHQKLLELLIALPCRVLISGYANPMYDATLLDWNRHTFNAKTHTGLREECLWFNFEPPRVLHDSRYIGANFRDRQSTKRRLQRLKDKIHSMDAVERAAFSEWLHKEYPPARDLPT